MALDPERRRQLHGLKLRALIDTHLRGDVRQVTGTDDGAVAVVEVPDGSRVVAALAEERPTRGLGPALAAAARAGTQQIHVFANGEASMLARRAAEFAIAPAVWGLDGRDAQRAAPAPPPSPPDAPQVPELVALLELADVEGGVEHGVVLGEIQGLEVARIVPDDLGHRLEVGVGAHDREAFGLLYGDLPTPDAIRRVSDLVRTHRAPAADPHPLNRLGAERWLRSRLIDQPDIVGARTLAAAPPPVPRTNLKEPVPAVAMGEGAAGQPMVVVTAVGIDLDLVPFAADARVMLDPSAELVVAVPERDAHDILHNMAGALREPARLVAIDDRWREWPAAASVA